MEVAYLYTKVRSEFGKQTNFSDQDTRILHTIPQTDEFEDDYVPRNPVCTTVDTCPTYSEHETNTDRLVTKASSIRHAEGGWPKDVDPTEKDQTTRYKKKVEKDEEYIRQVKNLGEAVESSIMQNYAIDIYQVPLPLGFFVCVLRPPREATGGRRRRGRC